MTMIKNAASAATLAFALIAGPAIADQYVVSLSEPLGTVNARIVQTLGIAVVDTFDHDGVSYAVIEARDEAYVEAFLKTTRSRATSLRHLPVDWSGEAMAGIDTGARLRFSAPVDCLFCS